MLDDLMSVIAPLLCIGLLFLGVFGVVCLHSYFITGEFDGIPAGVDILLVGIVGTLVGLVVAGGLIFMAVAAIGTYIVERKETKANVENGSKDTVSGSGASDGEG